MEDLVIAAAVWGDWPGSRQAQGGVFDNPDHFKAQRYQRRGGRAELQQEYIRRLANMVERNVHEPHQFVVFADDPRKVPAGIHAEKLDVPYISRAMPKACIYGAPFTGCPISHGTRILVLDLDVVITGDLHPLVNHNRELVARERKHRLPKLIPDGDIVYSLAGSDAAERVARIYEREVASQGAGTDHGDERMLLNEAGADCWANVAPGAVDSFKWGRKRGFSNNTRIVSFHGKPLPDEVNEEWVREHWR